MRYIKTYEDTQDELQIGDYVWCDEFKFSSSRYFTLNNIGQYVRKAEIITNPQQFMIRYENVPTSLRYVFTTDNCRTMGRSEIIFFSPNKEDCEACLAANKYNL